MNQIGIDRVGRKQRFTLSISNAQELPTELQAPSPYFACLLAWNACGVSAVEIGTLAEKLLQAGCAYICCWGPDSERVHDIFDEVDCHRKPDGPWCMSTWHSNNPLAEAICFSLFSALPDDAFRDGCRSVIAVSISSNEWDNEIRTAFADACA